MRVLLRRLFFYAVTAWAAITLNFILPRLMPGNPAQGLIERFARRLSPAAVHAIEVLFGQPHTSLCLAVLRVLEAASSPSTSASPTRTTRRRWARSSGRASSGPWC